MEEKDIIKLLKDSKEILNGIEPGGSSEQMGELLINAYDVIDWALINDEDKYSENGFALMQMIVAKDDSYKKEAISYLHNLKSKFKEPTKISSINTWIIDLQLDQVNMMNMRIIYREIEKSFGSDYVFQHRQEIIGNVAVAASIDKLTAKVSELIEVLKERE